MACVVWYIFYMICVYSELTWSSCTVQLTGTPEVVTAGRLLLYICTCICITEVNDVIVCVNLVPGANLGTRLISKTT